MEQSENQRIKIIREVLKLSQLDFSVKLNMKQGSISDIERGKAGVSNKLKEILYKDFYINRNWIENGIGDMFYKELLSQKSNITSDENSNQKEIYVNQKRGIESLSDMADINQSETGFKYPYANRPQNGLMQIIQNIESLQMMQNQQIELLKKHVFESMPKS